MLLLAPRRRREIGRERERDTERELWPAVDQVVLRGLCGCLSVSSHRPLLLSGWEKGSLLYFAERQEISRGGDVNP